MAAAIFRRASAVHPLSAVRHRFLRLAQCPEGGGPLQENELLDSPANLRQESNARKPSCFYPIPQAADCISRVVEKANTRAIYLSTDAAESETGLLQSLIVVNGRVVPLVTRPARNSAQKWDALLYRHGLDGDSQVEAMIDKTISAMPAVFIGASGFSFTEDILRLRKALSDLLARIVIDFRPDYQGLGILKQKFPTTPVLALTATARASAKELANLKLFEKLQLVHFGEKFDSTNCQKTCDNCLKIRGFVDKDATETAKQLVELVKLMGQQFSSAHILEVFRGSQSQYVKKHRPETLRLHGPTPAEGVLTACPPQEATTRTFRRIPYLGRIQGLFLPKPEVVMEERSTTTSYFKSMKLLKKRHSELTMKTHEIAKTVFRAAQSCCEESLGLQLYLCRHKEFICQSYDLGFILVSDTAIRHLFSMGGNEAIAFALAHETGHSVAFHFMEENSVVRRMIMCKRVRKMKGLPPLHKKKVRAYFRFLSRRDEKEADELAVMLMAAGGYDPAPIPKMLKSYWQANDPVNERFSTHPTAAERAKTVEKALGLAVKIGVSNLR